MHTISGASFKQTTPSAAGCKWIRIWLWGKKRKKYLHSYFNKRSMPLSLYHTFTRTHTSIFMYLCMYLLVASLRTFLLLCRLYLKLSLLLLLPLPLPLLPLLLLLFLSSPLWLCFTFLINKQAWQAHVLDYPACPCFALSSLAPLYNVHVSVASPCLALWFVLKLQRPPAFPPSYSHSPSLSPHPFEKLVNYLCALPAQRFASR